MKPGRFPAPLAFAALILIGAVALIAAHRRTIPYPRASLDGLMPASAEGWEVRDVAIADTPEMAKAVDQLLNFDDAHCRIYRRGDIEILVYVAIWRQNKMPARMIHTHTPDVCWPEAGWKLEALQNDWLMPGLPAPHDLAQWRKFDRGGQLVEVVFWHTNEGIPVHYGNVGLPPWWAPLYDMVRFGAKQEGRQVFLRISANTRLKEVTDSFPVRASRDLFAELLKQTSD